MPYPIEFRIAVAAAYDECGSSIEVAELFGCSESWVRRLVQRREATGGSLAPLTPKRERAYTDPSSQTSHSPLKRRHNPVGLPCKA